MKTNMFAFIEDLVIRRPNRWGLSSNGLDAPFHNMHVFNAFIIMNSITCILHKFAYDVC
jgi:hypothetical protein